MILVTEEIKLSNPEIKRKILMGSFKGNIEVAQTIYMLKCKPVFPFLISLCFFFPEKNRRRNKRLLSEYFYI